MDELLNSYRVLGLEPGAPHKEIKRAYRELVKTWHLGQFSGDAQKRQEAEHKLNEINLAFERLQAAHPAFNLAAALQAAYRITPSSGSKLTVPADAAERSASAGASTSMQRQGQTSAANSQSAKPSAPACPAWLEWFFGGSHIPLIATAAVLLGLIAAMGVWLSPRHTEPEPEEDPFLSLSEAELSPQPGSPVPARRRSATPGLDINAELPPDSTDDLPRLPPVEASGFATPAQTNRPAPPTPQ